ncbi:MAG TPA: YceI family protein [Verrucomicrobiales bacterium]|mgnify:CR=1 FL=1|nr:YceI family protein [Verrucomicrobiales bacterium]
MKYLPIAFPAVLAILGGISHQASAQTEKWKGSCNVTFTGESTLHNFSGKVAAEPFTVAVTGFDDPASATAACEVVVKAKGMNTDDEKRDDAMHKSLDITTYPEIAVDIAGMKAAETQPAADKPVPRPTVIPFTMRLKGKTHQLTGRFSDWSFDGKVVKCTVSFPVSLKDSGISPPSVLGFIKVKDEIKVSAHLVLTRP